MRGNTNWAVKDKRLGIQKNSSVWDGKSEQIKYKKIELTVLTL